MKYTQNKKIMQLTEKTVIIGADIASETQYVRAFDNRGIEIGKLMGKYTYPDLRRSVKSLNLLRPITIENVVIIQLGL